MKNYRFVKGNSCKDGTDYSGLCNKNAIGINRKWNKIFAIFVCTSIMALTGCSDISPSRPNTLAPTVDDVLQQGIANADQNNASGQDSSALDFSSQNTTNQNSSAQSNNGQNSSMTGNDQNSSSQNSASQASNSTGSGRQSGVNDGAPEPDPISESDLTNSSTDGIDIDLTTLSATVVYSEVYDMMFYPDNYVGKTVKMDGMFTYYYDEANDKYYFACIIMDATACCSQGIEFEPSEDFTYPDDFPEDGGDICVVGVFDTYEEDGFTYCTLRNAEIL